MSECPECGFDFEIACEMCGDRRITEQANAAALMAWLDRKPPIASVVRYGVDGMRTVEPVRGTWRSWFAVVVTPESSSYEYLGVRSARTGPDPVPFAHQTCGCGQCASGQCTKKPPVTRSTREDWLETL